MKVSNESDRADEELLIKTTKYRKSVVLVALNRACHHISYHAIRVVLTIYLTDVLLYSKSDAKIIFHVFNFMVCSFLVLYIVSPLGYFHTLLWMSLLSVTGSILISLATVPFLAMDIQTFSLIALFFMAVRLGGERVCFIKTLGNEQDEWTQKFNAGYSLFMWCIIFYTMIKVPLLRETSCLGESNCFTAIFAIPAGLMIISVVTTIVGKSTYTEPKENVAIKVVQCISYALNVKWNSKEPKEHWLDCAEGKYEKGFINGVKSLLKISFLALPLPIFWALFDQQGSSWTFQARMMAGDRGDPHILPDQMQAANVLLSLTATLAVGCVIYPLFEKLHIKTALQRIVISGLLTAASFFIAAKISIFLEEHAPIQPTNGIGHLRIYNTLPCELFVTNAPFKRFVLPPHKSFQKLNIQVEGEKNYKYTCICSNGSVNFHSSGQFRVAENQALSYYFSNHTNITGYIDSNERSENGYPTIRTLVNTIDQDVTNLTIEYYDKMNHWHLITGLENITSHHFKPGETYIRIGNVSKRFHPKSGGVYTVLVSVSNKNIDMTYTTLTPPYELHILWQLPQYFIISIGEIMFSNNCGEFMYGQVPRYMKHIVNIIFWMMAGFGNLLVVAIEALKLFEDESSKFFLYGALMIANMVLFAFMAYRYNYVEKKSNTEVNNTDESKKHQPKGVVNFGFTDTEKF